MKLFLIELKFVCKSAGIFLSRAFIFMLLICASCVLIESKKRRYVIETSCFPSIGCVDSQDQKLRSLVSQTDRSSNVSKTFLPPSLPKLTSSVSFVIVL